METFCDFEFMVATESYMSDVGDLIRPGALNYRQVKQS